MLGLGVGSFLNVIALRYKEGGRLFTKDVLVGRSRCPYCRKNLRWYELLPLVSFIIQLGRCRHCHGQISWQYPIVEILSGLTFVILPSVMEPGPLGILAVLTLILITFIDLRLSIIPDQLNLFLALLGVGMIVAFPSHVEIVSRVIGAVFGLGFFGLIILLTRGRGMGLGDLKLAGALGLLFGWPKIAVLVAIAFAVGGILAAVILLLKRKSLKDAIPFGPFLALASILVIFFGDVIINRYYPYF